MIPTLYNQIHTINTVTRACFQDMVSELTARNIDMKLFGEENMISENGDVNERLTCHTVLKNIIFSYNRIHRRKAVARAAAARRRPPRRRPVVWKRK